jgi:hypothetical protein
MKIMKYFSTKWQAHAVTKAKVVNPPEKKKLSARPKTESRN